MCTLKYEASYNDANMTGLLSTTRKRTKALNYLLNACIGGEVPVSSHRGTSFFVPIRFPNLRNPSGLYSNCPALQHGPICSIRNYQRCVVRNRKFRVPSQSCTTCLCRRKILSTDRPRSIESLNLPMDTRSLHIGDFIALGEVVSSFRTWRIGYLRR